MRAFHSDLLGASVQVLQDISSPWSNTGTFSGPTPLYRTVCTGVVRAVAIDDTSWSLVLEDPSRRLHRIAIADGSNFVVEIVRPA